MALQDFKITDGAISQYGVVSAPDRLVGDPQENKRVFDRLIRESVRYMFNGLVDALLASTGAGEIGAKLDSVAGDSVQAILSSLKLLLDTKAPSADMEAALGLKADASVTDTHVKDVEFDAATGKFRFIKQSGSVVEFDTALEKVATNWVYEASTQSLVLTLADGSEQRVPLSDFVTLTEFASSESIEFSVSGQKVTARIKAGSVTDAMLDSTLKTMLQSYVSAANTSAVNAKASEEAAAESARQAAASKAAAGTSAANAAESERQAALSEADAETSKRAAAESEAAAKAAQAAAEKARDEAQNLVGGDFIDRSEKGAAGGVATLDESGKVPSGQLPAMNYDPEGTAAREVSKHNAESDAHADIRKAVSAAQSKADAADTKAANAAEKAQAALDKPTANVSYGTVAPSVSDLAEEELRLIAAASVLPAGYKRLKSIKSTGAQAFDTNIKPRSNTRVVLDIAGLSTTIQWIFGSRDTASSGGTNQYCVVRANATSVRADYFGGTNVSLYVSDTTARTTIDYSANTIKAYGMSASALAYSGASCKYPMYLFAINDGGKVSANLSEYECFGGQIYEDGTTLSCNYIPCENAAGVVGLYDTVSGSFGGSITSTPFVAGEEEIAEGEAYFKKNGLLHLIGGSGEGGVKIETGSYKGTGTSGSVSKNSLTFSFTPKMWGVYAFDIGGSIQPLPNLWAYGVGTSVRMFWTSSYNYGQSPATYNGNTVSWYNDNGDAYQLNSSAYTYYYFAIG